MGLLRVILIQLLQPPELGSQVTGLTASKVSRLVVVSRHQSQEVGQMQLL